MAIHDVSHELRGEHGKWAKSGSVLHRMAGEAESAAKGKGGHEEILAQVQKVGRGTGRRVGGHRIDRTQKDKYRVGLFKPGGGRDTHVYDTPHDAAKAIHEGRHHEPGAARPEVARPEAAKPEAAKPESMSQRATVMKHLDEIPGLLGVSGQIQSSADRRVAVAIGDIKDELSGLPGSEDLNFIRGKMAILAGAEQDAAKRGGMGSPSARVLAARLGDLQAQLIAVYPEAAPAAKPESTKDKKVSVGGLPPGYTVHESSRKNYMDQPIREVHHSTEGHVADLVPITESVPQDVRGNVAYGGFKQVKGYNYKLVHPEVKAKSKADRQEAIKANSAYIPSYLQSRMTQPQGQAARSAIQAHEGVLKQARTPKSPSTEQLMAKAREIQAAEKARVRG